jgi:hypothetical protein
VKLQANEMDRTVFSYIVVQEAFKKEELPYIGMFNSLVYIRNVLNIDEILARLSFCNFIKVGGFSIKIQ